MQNSAAAGVSKGLFKKIYAWYKSLPRWSQRIITVLTVMVAGYWINPFDLPGPVDDTIVTIISMGVQYGIGEIGRMINRAMHDDEAAS